MLQVRRSTVLFREGLSSVLVEKVKDVDVEVLEPMLEVRFVG